MSEFPEGCLNEPLPWRIETDYVVCDLYGQVCRHCHSPRPGRHGGTERTCPRVVVAHNQAGHDSTAVCLDCILEAAGAAGGNP